MKSGFYRKTAWGNIQKNYRFFIPRILSEAGLLGCFYIALTLAMDGRLAEVRGGTYIPTFMWMGVGVLVLLSSILMLYTNSFLMKQRRREFGLYNVLGMEKRHIGRVLFHESAISSLASVAGGLCLGILFYKLCSLLICRLLEAEIVVGFYFITPRTVIPAGMFFLLLDLATYFINRIGINRMKPVELLASKAAGEREPKVKWLMLSVGVLTLGAGYYISITTVNPLEALLLFFVAVILVIIGTYFLFVTGSIFVLKALKRKEGYYYNKRHMPAVSGLLYRMKQNAVGLASIAILATGVLVMVSTTVSLYSGLEGTLEKNYPQDLYFQAGYHNADGDKKTLTSEELEEIARSAAARNGLEIESIQADSYLFVSYFVKDGVLYGESEIEGKIPEAEVMANVANFLFLPEENYRQMTGEDLQLGKKEVAVCRISSTVKDIRNFRDSLTIQGVERTIVRNLASFPINVPAFSSIAAYGVVVADREELDEIYRAQCEVYGKHASEMTERIDVVFTDGEKAAASGAALEKDMIESALSVLQSRSDAGGSFSYSVDSRWDARESLVGMYGTLLFLGILLGTVSLFATVLIIYYKQISEGYEDRDRFQIMEKIGMSRAEVRKTIGSQILLVFFLPLAVAGVHMAFAYPMLQRMLDVLSLYKKTLFLTCSLATYLVFALVYTLIYLGTSKTYYKIVH